LINASARYDLLSANEQLITFQLSKVMNEKKSKRKLETFNRIGNGKGVSSLFNPYKMLEKDRHNSSN
jgi:hypothetical protein